MLLLGAAFQRGHLPFSLEAMERSIAHAVAPEERLVNLSAFRAGRTLVARPEVFTLPSVSWGYAALFAEKQDRLRQFYGKKTAEAYRFLVEEAVLQLSLDDTTHRDLAVRVYDLVIYENLGLAKRYVDLVLATAKKDRRQWNHQATRALIRNAFHVMAIKDEIYVSHLLTSPEKRTRDQVRYRIDPSNGDRISYRHFNQPEFVLFGRRWRWDMVTRDWQLKILKRMKFLRRWLPGWHRAEREFRDWYLELAARFEAEEETAYGLWVNILRGPEDVRGYREIRQPKMKEAYAKARQSLKQLSGQMSGGRRDGVTIKA
jgi:indolepyruvate ferredoxin oxidoreductase